MITETNALPLDLVDLRKVRLHGLGVRVGEKMLVNQLTLPQQSKEHYVRRRRGHSERRSHHPKESKDSPFISTQASPEPLAAVKPWVQQVRQMCTEHIAPKQLRQVQ